MARRFAARDMGKSVRFAGSTHKVDLGADFLGVGALTVMAWIKLDRVGNNSGRIVDNGKLILNQASGGVIRFRSDGTSNVSTASALPMRQWVHIAVTRDSAGLCSMYLNGVLDGAADRASGTPATATTNLTVGQTTGDTNNFQGDIDELRTFNRRLTATEILNIVYDAALPSDAATTQNLFIDFDDNVLDRSGAGHNGTLTGASYVADTFKKARTAATSRTAASNRVAVRDMGTALSFDGADDTVESPHNANQLLTTGFTLSAWIKPRSLGENSNGRILDKSVNTNAQSGFVWRMDATAGNSIALKVDTGTTRVAGASAIRLNSWNHVLTTVSSAALVTHYIGGAVSGTPGTSSGFAGFTTTNALAIGNRSTATDRTFDGIIGEIHVFNRAFSASEALNMYLYGSYPPGTLVARYLFDEASGSVALDSSGNGNHGTITGATYTTDTAKRLRTAV